jgi:peptidoglycan/xylan/chitin deacetylase (PgdA/CDA1 family)
LPANTTIVDAARGRGDVVSLTFDDGPNAADTVRLLAVLRRHRVGAVFCLWGDRVVEQPELVREIVAAGHVLCNHGMHHDDMGTWTTGADRGGSAGDVRRHRPCRPGRAHPVLPGAVRQLGPGAEVAARLGMQPLGWRLGIADWETPGTEVLVDRLVEGITPGAVVLLHDGGGDRSQTVDAVDRIIPVFRAQGWRFTLPARRG